MAGSGRASAVTASTGGSSETVLDPSRGRVKDGDTEACGLMRESPLRAVVSELIEQAATIAQAPAIPAVRAMKK